jgi:hypothetical protein
MMCYHSGCVPARQEGYQALEHRQWYVTAGSDIFRISQAATSYSARDDTHCCALFGDLVDSWIHLFQVCVAV